MSWIATNTPVRPWRQVRSVAFVVLLTMILAAHWCTAQELQQGVSVELAVTQNAVARPDADRAGALIVAVTHSGNVYLGIERITPAALAEKRDLFSGAGEEIFVKADARTPYANVTKVLEALRTAGVTAPNLLTAQHETPQPGKLLSPKALEVRVAIPLPSGAELTVIQILNLGERGPRVKINDEDIPWTNLESGLRHFFPNRSEKVVLLKADGQLPFTNVVHVIDLCRSTGAKVYLVTPAM